jgi:hypothetical protein
MAMLSQAHISAVNLASSCLDVGWRHGVEYHGLWLKPNTLPLALGSNSREWRIRIWSGRSPLRRLPVFASDPVILELKMRIWLWNSPSLLSSPSLHPLNGLSRWELLRSSPPIHNFELTTGECTFFVFTLLDIYHNLQSLDLRLVFSGRKLEYPEESSFPCPRLGHGNIRITPDKE